MIYFIKKRILSILNASGVISNSSRGKLDAFMREHASNKKTLDIGSGGKGYRVFFPNSTSSDIVASTGVDVVADVHELSKHFRGDEFDIIVCAEALEHFYCPHRAIEEMQKVLKRGGTLILTTRFIFPLHEVPQDYFRFTEYGLKYLLRDFDIVEFKPDSNTVETLAILCERIGFQCDTLWFKPLKLLWFISSKILKLFSRILTKEYGEINQRNRINAIMSAGYFVVAKKK